MASPALRLVALFSIAVASPQNFYYEAPYQPAYYTPYQPAYQAAFPPAYQPAYSAFNPQLLPIPLAAQSIAHPYIPAVATYSIYSTPSRLLRGYSYETQDTSGGHGQVIYVAGPDSQKIFEQNAKALHFALPNLHTIVPVPTNETKEEKPAAKQKVSLPQVYLRAEVLPPQTGGPAPTFPLFAYSVYTNVKKSNESKINQSNGSLETEETSMQKEDTDEDPDSATTLAPSAIDNSDSSPSSDAPVGSDATSAPKSTDETQNKTDENSTDELEMSTNTSDP